MRVFITGASGHVATALIPELLSAGHHVVGLARSDSAATAVTALGAEVRRGDLDDLDTLASAADDADAVVHLAFKHDAMRSGDLAAAAEADLAAVRAMTDVMHGTDKAFVGTSGTALIPMMGVTGRPGRESDRFDSGYRIDAENLVVGLADNGVRSSVIRLTPTVHSDLDHHGFVPALIGFARHNGFAGYVGDGANRWPAVHTRDAARLYRLALESAPTGSVLHAVGEPGVAFRDIAEAIGRGLGVPAKSVAAEEATNVFDFLASFVTVDNPTSSEFTRRSLNWTPEYPGLVEDIDSGHYFRESVG
ncbi:SDR family oxidoreductase [Gordonia sp. CPCC 206044]|uniref:SDR family oxidoreductase n=1 Tax=Gordonia sp. CPCC 206044 TaxID=3140793 RepID=UPI003AF3F5C1